MNSFLIKRNKIDVFHRAVASVNDAGFLHPLFKKVNGMWLLSAASELRVISIMSAVLSVSTFSLDPHQETCSTVSFGILLIHHPRY